MQFYAGVPLRTEHGLPIGTLCELDTVPRSLTEIQLQALKVLGRQVMARIILRKSLERETQLNQRLQRQRNELLQMIVNLIHNAIRYTLVGGKIWLSCELESGVVVIRIKDTGKGNGELDRERIFKLFVQLQGADGSSSDGLGLGLSLVHELAQLHGGEVEVASDSIGLGSTFSIRLPLAPAVEDTPQQQHSITNDNEATQRISESPLDNQSDSDEGYDVLITDDNLDSIRALGRLPQRRGHQVRLTGSGKEALQAIQDHLPVVLLLDIGLPDMTGYDLAHQIRQRADGRAMLLIAITGYGQPKDRLRSEQAGFDHHLTKPVVLEQLHELIQQHRKYRTSTGS